MFLEEEEEGPESSLSYTREGKAGEDTVFIDGWMDGWMNEWPWRGSIFIRSFRSGKISGSVSLLICMFLFHCALSLECP